MMLKKEFLIYYTENSKVFNLVHIKIATIKQKMIRNFQSTGA